MTGLTLPDTPPPGTKPPAPDYGPPTEIQGVTATTDEPDFGDRFSAGWQQRTVETDAFEYTARLEAELMDELFLALPADAQSQAQLGSYRAARNSQNGIGRGGQARARLYQQIDILRQNDPSFMQGRPATEEEFQAEILRRRQRALGEARDLLSIDGQGVGGFLGGLSRDVADPINLALAPFGVQGGIIRTVLAETALGGVAAGLSLPREFEVARELGEEPPNVVERVVTEALASGGLGLVFSAGARGFAYMRQKRHQIALDKVDPAMPSEVHEDAQLEAEARLMDEVPERPLTRQDGQQFEPPDFDYSATGNASPQTNRVGYVFGRLIETGMEPHIAAGFVGNFMQESGAGLNPRAIGDNGNSFGIAQHNGPRRHALIRFAQARGRSWDDLDTQIAFVLHELETTEAGAWARIRSARTAEEAAALVSQHFERPGVPHLNRRLSYANGVIDQFESGSVPVGAKTSPGSFVPYTGTARGYTQAGQVRTAGGTTIDVEYEVIDASLLTRATGDLQPRDRGQINSDAQIAGMASDLDPALLMPSPTADRGAPVVGPDNTIESGNGRVSAITQAAERFPDRFEAYRLQLEAAGFTVPEGAQTPVLIARRTSDLDGDARRAFVIDAQDSGVARMTPEERARAEATLLDPATLARLDPGRAVTDAGNAGFVRAALARLSAAERNAFTTPKGGLNRDGQAALQRALFARAFNDPDLLRRFVEEEAGELRSLLDALAEASPQWAQLTADIASGRVRPEFDISGHVIEAMRIIASARDVVAADGGRMGDILAELINNLDLLDGAVSPLTRALVSLFWRDGKAASRKKIGSFLTRYADEARKVGRVDPDLFGEPAGVIDVLQTIEPRAFADLTETGSPRGSNAAPAPRVEPAAPSGAFSDGALAETAQDAAQDAYDELRASIETDGDFEVPVGDGVTVKASDLLDDLDDDDALNLTVEACVRREAVNA
ncbi:MAG: phage tail tip lysozyme [Pseudomonadota bacterium]